MVPPVKLRMLIAPLDWGLGHATRCIPIIKILLERKIEVIIASDGAQQNLLQAEFPSASFVSLPGYRIRYARTAVGTGLKIAAQLPGLFKRIREEHGWLKQYCRQNSIDAIISDNRYGLFVSGIPSIFITHQLFIQTGFGSLVDRWIMRRHFRLIGRFSACWVPDLAGIDCLAGILSHPPAMPSIPVEYIGPLSSLHASSTAPAYKLLVMLSGPEPQRTVLEEQLLAQLKKFPVACTVVRGLPGTSALPGESGLLAPAGTAIYNHVSRAELSELLSRAEYVIARSGYTSIMETALLRKKTILIPTPGQPEQEYLAKYLAAGKRALVRAQDGFQLEEAMTAATAFLYELPVLENNNALITVLEALINQCGIGKG